MKHQGLDHVAIVVPDTDDALRLWRDTFGFPLVCSEVVNNGTVRLTHLDLGNTHLQLVRPLTADHPLQSWLTRNGGAGPTIFAFAPRTSAAHTPSSWPRDWPAPHRIRARRASARCSSTKTPRRACRRR